MKTIMRKLLYAVIWTVALLTLRQSYGYVILIGVSIGISVICLPFLLYSEKKHNNAHLVGILGGIWAALLATAITQRHEDLPRQMAFIAKELLNDPITLALLAAPVWIDFIIVLLQKRATKDSPTCASSGTPEAGRP